MVLKSYDLVGCFLRVHLQKLTRISTFNLEAPASESLLLEISEFDFRGSEGSGTFGKPNDILEKDGVREALGKLRSLLSGEQDDYLTDAEASAVRFQAGGPYDCQSPVHITQADFSTQVYQPLQVVSGSRSVDTSNLPVARNHLLALLCNPKRSGVVSEGGNTTPSRDSVLAPLSRDKVSAGRLHAKASNQLESVQSARGSSSTNSDSPNLVKCGIANEHSLMGSDSEKENSQEGRKGKKHLQYPFTLRSTTQAAAVEPETQVVTHPFYDQFQEASPFEGMKRVPRRYVRIPTAQQSLLERDDAWFETQETGRARYANIPAQVEADLAGFTDGRPRNKSSHSQNEESSPDSSSSEVDDSDDDMSSGDVLDDTRDLRNASFNNGLRESKPSRSVTDGQSQSPFSTSHPRDGKSHSEPDVEPKEEDDDVLSWGPSDRGSVELNAIVPPVPTNQVDDVPWQSSTAGAGKRASFAEESPRGLQLLSLRSPHHEIAKPPFRIRPLPDFPASSPADDEDLELGLPFAVGDQAEEQEGEREIEEPPTSQHLPFTGPQSSRSVQVERTPNQIFPGRSHLSFQAESPKQSVKHMSPDVFSDPVIPATFPGGSHHLLAVSPRVNGSAVNYSHEDTDDHTSDEEDDYFADALDKQQDDDLPQRIELEAPLSPHRMTQPHSPSYIPLSSRLPMLKENLSVNSTEPMTIRAPSPILGFSSPALQNSPFDLGDRVQVPTTQASPVDSSKRNSSHRSPESPAAKRYRSTISSLIEKDESPRRDTREMARLCRHTFNGSFNDGLLSAKESVTATRYTRSSPSPTPAIQGNIPKVGSAVPQLWNPVMTFAVEENSTAKGLTPGSSGDYGQIQQLPKGVSPAAETRVQLTAISGAGEPSSGRENVAAKQAANLANDQLVVGVRVPSSLETTASFESFLTGPVVNSAVKVTAPTKYADPSPLAQLSYFDEFQSIYPEFTGSERRFTEALVYIEWLRNNNQPLHAFLCDDFIRVYCLEYVAWARQQRREGKPPITGWEYYDENIPKPDFQYGIITPKNLPEAVASLNKEYVDKVRNMFYQNTLRPRKSLPAADTQMSGLSPQTRFTKVPYIESSQPVSAASAARDHPVSPAHPAQATAEAVVNFEELDETYLSMQTSNRCIRADLLDHVMDPSKAGGESGRRSSITSAELEETAARHPSLEAKISLRAALKARKPFFETPSQLPHSQREKPESSHAVVLTGLTQVHSQSEQSSRRKTSIQSLPWATKNSPRIAAEVMSSPHRKDSASSSSRPQPAPQKSMSNEQLGTSQKSVREASLWSEGDELTTSRKSHSASRKRHREDSPILDSSPESEFSAPPPKQRKLKSSKSATSSIRQRNSSRVPSSPVPRISSREVAALPEVDGAARLGGWLEGLQQETPQQEEPAPVPNPKVETLKRSESKKHDPKKAAPLSFKERVKGFVRKKDRVSTATASKISSAGSTPVEVRSVSGGGSGIASDYRGKGKAKAVEPETQGWKS